MEKALRKIIHNLLELHEVPHTVLYIDEMLRKASRRSVLENIQAIVAAYDMEYMLVQIGYEELTEIPLNSVLPISWGRYQAGFLKEVNERSVTLMYPGSVERIISRSNLLLDWDGQALLVAAAPVSREPAYERHIQREKEQRYRDFFQYGILITVVIFVLMLFYLHADTSVLWATIAIKITGIIVGLLIIEETTGSSNGFVSKICSVFQKEKGCKTVLQSRQSRIFGFSLAELSFGYFLAGLFIVLASPATRGSALIYGLQWINFLALPFVCYSFFQQLFNTGWCTLCVSIAALLLLEFLVFQGLGMPAWSFHESDLLVGVLAISVPFGFLFYWSPISKMGRKLVEENRSLIAFKKEPEYLRAILDLGNNLTQFPAQYDLELGNGEARHQIIFIFSAHCEPCKEAYIELKQMMMVLGDHLSIKVIPILTELNNEMGAATVKALLAYFKEVAELSLRRKAIDELIAIKDVNPFTISEWMSIHPSHLPDQELDPYVRWFQENQINYTPYVLLDGKQLQADLSLEEVKQYLKLVVNS